MDLRVREASHSDVGEDICNTTTRLKFYLNNNMIFPPHQKGAYFEKRFKRMLPILLRSFCPHSLLKATLIHASLVSNEHELDFQKMTARNAGNDNMRARNMYEFGDD